MPEMSHEVSGKSSLGRQPDKHARIQCRQYQLPANRRPLPADLELVSVCPSSIAMACMTAGNINLASVTAGNLVIAESA